MSRSNPYKRKRIAKRTVLICGEGDDEEYLLLHLRQLYSRNTGICVKIKNAHGGSPLYTVQFAVKLLGDFSQKIVLVDSDRSLKEIKEAKQLAIRNNILYLECKPCIEAEILCFINENEYSIKSTMECKKELKKIMQNKKIKTFVNFLEKKLSRKVMDKKQKKVKDCVLTSLINILSKKN